MDDSGTQEQYCLSWKYFQHNLQEMFPQLLERQVFCDVTLASEGKVLRAHKVVLCACSSYFDTILSQYEAKDPVVILKDVKFSDIEYLMEYMYKGEVNVAKENLPSLLKLAEELQVKGLAEMSVDERQNICNINNEVASDSSRENSVIEIPTVVENNPRPESASNSVIKQHLTVKKKKRGRRPGKHNGETVILDSDGKETSDHDNSSDDFWEPNRQQRSKKGKFRKRTSLDMDNATDDAIILPKFEVSIESMMSGPDRSNLEKANCLSVIDPQFPGVIQMDTYLVSRSRQQFWEEPFTKDVLEAVKNKNLELKTAARILGVTYGTLYGRYREVYGCLKDHTKQKDWVDQISKITIEKLKRNEIDLAKAATELNLSPNVLAKYVQQCETYDLNPAENHPNVNYVSSFIEESDTDNHNHKYPLF